MIKTLNYIVGLAVLLVAFGIPLRIYLLNSEEQNRERMLEDPMPQANVPTTSHGNQSKLLDLSIVPDATMIDLLKQLDSDLPAYLASPQGVLQDSVTDDPGAMDRYLKTLEQDPANHKAIYDLAIRYLESGDVDQAGKLAKQLKQYDQSLAGNLRELIKKVRRDEQE
jgi:hypothetical protein